MVERVSYELFQMAKEKDAELADLRTAIDYALAGDLLDATARITWLRSWRKGDKMREQFQNKTGSEMATKHPE